MYSPRVSSAFTVVVLRDFHEGGTDQPVLERISLTKDLHDRSFGLAGDVFVAQRLVDLRIERQAERILHRDPLALEQGQQVAPDELDALPERGFVALRFERPIEVVEAGHERL